MIGSLFSGIGGLELGLERAGLGPVAWQVEVDPFCRLVLERHWPHAERFEDVRSVGAAELAPVDVICGGFPCQDVSSAGRGAGLTGSRSGLWSEYRRIVSELNPEWVVVENVLGGATRWFDRVVRELEELGYGCLPFPLSAQDVGAPHLRRRLFVVAHRSGEQRSLQSRGWLRENGSGALQPDRVGLSRNTSDAHGECREGAGPGAHESGFGPTSSGWWASECPVAPVVHGLSTRLAGGQRRRRIRALGNAVVPQCAEVVGWVVRELIEEQQLAANCGGAP